MNIQNGYDAKTISRIAKASGAYSVKEAATYLRVPCYRAGGRFLCEVIDDVAFYAGSFGKTHFRLYEMAVIEDKQREGYGTFMIMRIKQLCQKKGIPKITLRTSKEETAIDFYRRQGGKIVGEKDNDWEVEILL